MDFIKILAEKYKLEVNEQQRKAVMHGKGVALVLAGPGSGKTTVITARTAYLIMELKIKPENILTLTFNRAAKFEMEQRFNTKFNLNIGKEVHFHTFHSFCNYVVRDYEKRQGKRLKNIEDEHNSQVNKRVIIKNIYKQINSSNINDEELESLINEISLVKNMMMKEFDNTNFNTKNFSEVFLKYEAFKKENYYMDFDDMLTFTYSILKKCPDICNRYQRKYPFIQVDEGQDFSKIQFEILKILVESTEKNIFIVADDDQSIYGFRGAEPKYILDIEKQFGKCKFFYLENNYRSTKNIVGISSNFIKKNKERFDKKHSTKNKYKYKPSIIQVSDQIEQLEFIIKIIKEKQFQNNKMSIGILYRNNLSALTVVDILNRNKIPFNLRQNRLFFFKHWVILDIIAFLKFSFDQNDYNSFYRIYYKMNRYISKSMIEQAMNVENTECVIDSVLMNQDIQPYQRKNIAGLKKEFKHMRKMSPILALDYIEYNFMYFDHVKNYCENTGVSYDYLYGLFGILRTIAQECSTIAFFIQRMMELEIIFRKSNSAKKNESITLTTLHSSKGLEYDCVIMIDLNNEDIPGIRALNIAKKDLDDSLIEEERRLFYVGITRAREFLYLINSQIVNREKVERSVFVEEVISCINDEILSEIGEGMLVYHKKFGSGVVASILKKSNGKIILSINFEGSMKKIDFLTCLGKGILSF